jgi:hypothetical protein
MHILLLLTQSPSWDEALCFSRQVRLKTEGSLSLLAVVPDITEAEKLRQALTANLTPKEHNDLNIRLGNFHEQVLKEIQQGNYDLTVIGADPAGDERAAMLTPAAHLARTSQTPLAIVRACPQDPQRALICSREADLDLPTVRSGQDLVNRMGIEPTVLHVQAPEARDLDSSAPSSENILIRQGPLISEIQKELARQQYDLVIIGPHSVPPTGTERGPTLARPDFTHQIIRLNPPVVIVIGRRTDKEPTRPFRSVEIKRILQTVAIELLIYAVLVTLYAVIAFQFLGKPLAELFGRNLVLYAVAALILIIAQGVLLEQLTSFLLDRLRLERFE